VVDPPPVVLPEEVEPVPGPDGTSTCPTGYVPIGISIDRVGHVIVLFCRRADPGFPGPVVDPLPADPIRHPVPADPVEEAVPAEPVEATPTTRAEALPEPDAPPPAVRVVERSAPAPDPPDPVERPATAPASAIGLIPPDAPPG
jgi:hypothetical protein